MNITAKWIKAPEGIGEVSPEFRKLFSVNRRVIKAEICVSAYGVYSLSINGNSVDGGFLTPGYTSYGTRVQYQRYDITSLIREYNTISITAAKGWACGAFGFRRAVHKTCDAISIIASLELTLENGEVRTVLTDDTWEVYTSPIRFSEIYDGETVDFTVGLKCLGSAVVNTEHMPMLVPQQGESVREKQTVFASELIITPKGERVIDFGQNLAGYVTVSVKGKHGDRITISHAEVLDRDGNFYTDNLRSAKTKMEYVLDGTARVLKPTFTFQGFRYIRLDEYPTDDIRLEDFSAVAVYSDMKRTGHFVCGYDKLNRLYSNTIWGQRSNFIDIPTDCPQRDERMGWTGDAQVFCRTAALNYDVERFFEKWLADMAIEQSENGIVYGVVPKGELCNGGISAAWGDAAVIVPFEMWRAYGDKEKLRGHFPMMKKWVDYMHSAGDEEFLWMGTTRYGDWLALDGPSEVRIGATQIDLVASAYYAYSTSLLVKAGHILGEDVSEYEELYKNVRAAFRSAFMKDGLPAVYPKGDGDPNKDSEKYKLSIGRETSADTQTAISLILRFGLCEEDEKQGLADRLCELIAANGGRMTTGFVGTPYILHALSDNGKVKEAYDLLFQEKNPSWLFSVNMGATTIWEHWDGINENGEMWSKGMNSFNHYAYGSVFDWVFGNCLGIDVCEDGAAYKKIKIAPLPDRRLGFAEGYLDTRSGRIFVSWRYIDDKVRYEVHIPEGTTATLKLGSMPERTVGGGAYTVIA